MEKNLVRVNKKGHWGIMGAIRDNFEKSQLKCLSFFIVVNSLPNINILIKPSVF